MKLFQIILVLISFISISNCVGMNSENVDIKKIKKERKLPEPILFKPDAQYLTAGNGEIWNLRHFMNFRFWSPPYFNPKESKQHKDSIYMALNHLKDYEVVSWYSKTRDAGGKVRPLFTYPANSGICRDFQVLLYIEKKAKHKTFTACRTIHTYGWLFNYWDWPGAEKYLN